ncbi:hypothetical protein HBI81_249350 [Parastagonospora nodorum]|nr:hypothetical protein HBI81_249350 [Parastagonospora nodorum]
MIAWPIAASQPLGGAALPRSLFDDRKGPATAERRNAGPHLSQRYEFRVCLGVKLYGFLHSEQTAEMDPGIQ